MMLDADADDDARWLVINVIAHELAHQVISKKIISFLVQSYSVVW